MAKLTNEQLRTLLTTFPEELAEIIQPALESMAISAIKEVMEIAKAGNMLEAERRIVKQMTLAQVNDHRAFLNKLTMEMAVEQAEAIELGRAILYAAIKLAIGALAVPLLSAL